jgi:hypothetical protein
MEGTITGQEDVDFVISPGEDAEVETFRGQRKPTTFFLNSYPATGTAKIL